jgi:hypothetical protein
LEKKNSGNVYEGIFNQDFVTVSLMERRMTQHFFVIKKTMCTTSRAAAFFP